MVKYRTRSESEIGRSRVKAVRANATKTVVVEERQTPTAGPGNVIVKTLKSGICGSDLHIVSQLRRGLTQNEPLVGHEVCGIVSELGSGVETARVGDRVAIEPLWRCGVCTNCIAGRYNVCDERKFMIGNFEDQPGGLSEYFEIPAYCLVPVDDSLSDEEGALTEPLAVGVHAIKVVRPGYRPSVGVVGAGTIGLAVVAAAAAAGASNIVVVARHPHQREAAEKLGATRAIAIGDDDSEETIRECLDGDQPPEIVVETVGGAAETINTALKLVHSGGAISMVGGFWESPKVDLEMLLMKEIRLVSSNCYASEGGSSDFEDSMAIMQSNPLFAETMLTHRFPLEAAADAFRTAFDKSTGSIKVMLSP